MQPKISQKQRFYRIASMLTILTGVGLVSYMILVEGELGALPLFLLTTGIVLFIISKIKFKPGNS